MDQLNIKTLNSHIGHTLTPEVKIQKAYTLFAYDAKEIKRSASSFDIKRAGLIVAYKEQPYTWLYGDVTTIATCWKLTRSDGTVMGFTDHSKDITYADQVYVAKTGYDATAISSTNSMAVDNLDIDGTLSSDAITEADITAGLYQEATIEVFQINYMDITLPKRILRRGVIGNITRNDFSFTAEMRGIAQLAQRNIGELYSDTCRANLGDSRCKVAIANYTFTGMVVSVADDSFLISISENKAADYFTNGFITFTSGFNNEITMEITSQTKSGTNDIIVPFLPLPHAVAAGDTFSIVAGCSGDYSVCRYTFNNYLNFRGEPNIPGTDTI